MAYGFCWQATDGPVLYQQVEAEGVFEFEDVHGDWHLMKYKEKYVEAWAHVPGLRYPHNDMFCVTDKHTARPKPMADALAKTLKGNFNTPLSRKVHFQYVNPDSVEVDFWRFSLRGLNKTGIIVAFGTIFAPYRSWL